MAKRQIYRRTPEGQPWEGPDVLHNAIASADWGSTHPGLCYEVGDPNGEVFIPPMLVKAILNQRRLVVGVWQWSEVTLIDMKHTPERSLGTVYANTPKPVSDWAAIQRYRYARRSVASTELDENLDPQPICWALRDVLGTQLGSPPPEQELLLDEPIKRIVVEFPDYAESRPLPLDTSISVLASLATQQYLEQTRLR